MKATLAEANAEIGVTAAVTTETEANANQTAITALLGDSRTIGPAMETAGEKAEEITATVFARSTSLVTQRGLMRTRTQVDYQINGEPAPPALPCPQNTSSCVYRPRECGPWRILTANPS